MALGCYFVTYFMVYRLHCCEVSVVVLNSNLVYLFLTLFWSYIIAQNRV